MIKVNVIIKDKKWLKFLKNPSVTIENLKARAENGSLLSIKGFVVINAEDQSITNKNGNIFTISSYKPKLGIFC